MDMDQKAKEGEYRYRSYRDDDLEILSKLVRTTWDYDSFLPEKTAACMAKTDLLGCLTYADYTEVVEQDGIPVGFLLASYGKSKEKKVFSKKKEEAYNRAKEDLKKCPFGGMLLFFTACMDRVNEGLIKKSHTPYFTELSFFVLQESCRGKGIGKSLYQHLLCALNQEGINGLYVKTDTMSNYRFYEHMGFRRAAKKQFGIPFLKKAQISLLLYEKSLVEIR